MSKIVKATVNVDMNEREVLKKALSHFGRVSERGKNGINLHSDELRMRSMSFDWGRDGRVQVKYDEDDHRAIGLLRRVEDRYLAHHYEKGLVEEGFEVSINELQSGALELVANEAGW